MYLSFSLPLRLHCSINIENTRGRAGVAFIYSEKSKFIADHIGNAVALDKVLKKYQLVFGAI